MSENGATETVTVNIDGKDYAVPKGTNMIEAVKMAGKGREVPHYCYHPKLSVVGNCRMCMVEIGMPMKDRSTGEAVLDEEGNQKISWMPKPGIACSTQASPGMHVRTDTDLVRDCRNGVTEFLLINHPLDCPICDQAGECTLQEFSAQYGRGYSRFTEEKNVKPKRTRLGPRVMLDDERCILCSRCVRFCQEIVDDDVLGFVDRGTYSTLTCYPGRELANNYSLNTVDICPVGALTSTDFRFKMRVWFLKRTNSICTESSVGANTEVWSREGKIYRVTPRRNDAVNDTWMTDSGRALYKDTESDRRLTQYEIDGVRSMPDAAANAAVELLREGDVALVASARSTVEEQAYQKLLAERTGAGVYWVSHYSEGDGLLLSEDRTPNLRGVLINGLADDLPPPDLSALRPALRSGAVKTLVVVHEDVTELGLSEEDLEGVNVLYFGFFANATSERARVVLPSLMVFEKEGSFINQNFRLQRFAPAIPGPRGVLPDVEIWEKITAPLADGKPATVTMDALWERLAERVGAFAGLGWRAIPELGVDVDPGPLAELPFVETKNLKHDPETRGAGTPVGAGSS